MATLDEQIAVMQAAKEGKPIQYRVDIGNGKWEDCHAPAWNWTACDYRVKPNPPREFWLNIAESGVTGFYRSRESADRQPMDRIECIHLREVFDDQPTE